MASQQARLEVSEVIYIYTIYSIYTILISSNCENNDALRSSVLKDFLKANHASGSLPSLSSFNVTAKLLSVSMTSNITFKNPSLMFETKIFRRLSSLVYNTITQALHLQSQLNNTQAHDSQTVNKKDGIFEEFIVW